MRLAHYRNQWQAPVNAVIKTFCSIRDGQFFDGVTNGVSATRSYDDNITVLQLNNSILAYCDLI